MDLLELIKQGVILIKCKCGKVFFGKFDQIRDDDYLFECPECKEIIKVSKWSLKESIEAAKKK